MRIRTRPARAGESDEHAGEGVSMKRILVPTDGSEAAGKALEVALDLARQHRAGVTLMHVLLRDKEPGQLLRLPEVAEAGADVVETLRQLEAGPAPERTAADLMGHPDAPNRPAPEPVLRSIGALVLARARDRAAQRGVRADVLDLSDGAVAPAIVSAAASAGADAIVMGTRGLRQIEAVAFGSVSQEVCRTAPCTCVAVH